MIFSRVRWCAALLFCAFSAAVASTGSAFAHAHLLSSEPAAKAMAMPAPADLKLKFSEALEPKLSKVKITGPENKDIKTGPAHVEPSDGTVLVVPFDAALADGTYKVDWQVVAKDGHKTSGSYSFDVMN